MTGVPAIELLQNHVKALEAQNEGLRMECERLGAVIRRLNDDLARLIAVNAEVAAALREAATARSQP